MWLDRCKDFGIKQSVKGPKFERKKFKNFLFNADNENVTQPSKKVQSKETHKSTDYKFKKFNNLIFSEAG